MIVSMDCDPLRCSLLFPIHDSDFEVLDFRMLLLISLAITDLIFAGSRSKIQRSWHVLNSLSFPEQRVGREVAILKRRGSHIN